MFDAAGAWYRRRCFGQKSRSSPSIPERQALLVPTICRIFQELRVGAAIFQDGYWPELIHGEDSLITFEMDYGLQGDRYGYNERCFDRVRRTKASLVAQHGGLHDLFVPILIRGNAEAILATGPFMTARPTHRQILERWRALSGRQGHHADPKFARYLSLTFPRWFWTAMAFGSFGCSSSTWRASSPKAVGPTPSARRSKR